MPTRTCKRKTRRRDDQNEVNSPHCSFARLDTETNSLSEEQVDEISLRIENDSTRKMKNEIRKSRNNILKVLDSLSENSLRKDHNGSSAQITSDGAKVILVQPASHELDSDRENIDPNESFIGAQSNLHDN